MPVPNPSPIGIDKANAIMRQIRFAMFTTEMGSVLRSRPMALVQPLQNDEVLFLTARDAPKVGEMREHREVNVTFSDPHAGYFVSLSGDARVEDDRAVIERIWSPLYQAWFPQGLEDPRLALIRVHVHHAEYWDRTSNRMVAIQAPKAAAAPAHEKPAAEPAHTNPSIMHPVDEETD